MEKLNYKKLGFKCGLEIHQQLAGKKLFCECPVLIETDKPDSILKRRLRAVAGETGEIDVAAKHEMKKKKYFIYHVYDNSNCLVDVDEAPPTKLNMEALNVALQISKMLNASIVDELQVMRKTVVDGSTTTGFQRTALVAMNGHIKTSLGKVSIPTICLEEEAAQAVKRTKEYDTYNLSRLGIPLIEIATGPEIKNPEHAKEVASTLGMILRSTGKVKRGIGSIRQDVNLSVKGCARTEIKGFQDLKSIPKVIEKEIQRHLGLIKKGKKPKKEVRKAEQDFTTTFLRPMPGAARMYPETDTMPVKLSTKGIKVPKLITSRVKEYVKAYKISEEIAGAILKREIDFSGYVKKFRKIKPMFIAETLVNTPKEIRRRYSLEIDISKHAEEVLSKLNQGKISKEAVIETLVELAKGKKVDYSKYKTISDEEVGKEIKKIINQNKGAPFGALMGMAMSKFRGKVDGKKVSEMLKKELS